MVCPNSSGAFDLVGIVSFGPGFCRDQVGVFTEVSAFSDWIKFKGDLDLQYFVLVFKLVAILFEAIVLVLVIVDSVQIVASASVLLICT